jgi:hypothetical protein
MKYRFKIKNNKNKFLEYIKSFESLKHLEDYKIKLNENNCLIFKISEIIYK